MVSARAALLSLLDRVPADAQLLPRQNAGWFDWFRSRVEADAGPPCVWETHLPTGSGGPDQGQLPVCLMETEQVLALYGSDRD